MRLSFGTTLLAFSCALTGVIACGSADPAPLFDDGTGGHAANASDAAAGAGGTTSSGDAAAGGSTPDGGSASSGGASNSSGGSGSGTDSGSGGSNGGASSGGATSDGGSNGSGGACETQKWCRDRDKDGHGDPDESREACEAPGSGWVTECDDCADGNALVHPGAECQTTGYTLSDGVAVSFDFDCDGSESECGDIAKATGNCGPVGPLACSGSGYLPNPDRKATDEQNAYCGSTAYRNCVSVGIPCVAQTVEKPAVNCR